MSTPQGSLRQRSVPGSSKKKGGAVVGTEPDVVAVTKPGKKSTTSNSEMSYRIAFAAITALAFVTRFWGINHPNEVVFDEVHFGKVSSTQSIPYVSMFSVKDMPKLTYLHA
jgi:dolichyl-phosphate-mannose-protein mannosyltransferase